MPPSGGGGFYEKFFFAAIVVVSLLFTACIAPTEVRTLSASGVESSATFKEFFNPVRIVHSDSDVSSAEIIMDKNTGVLYVMKWSGYQWGMSPIYDSDDSVLTYENGLQSIPTKILIRMTKSCYPYFFSKNHKLS